MTLVIPIQILAKIATILEMSPEIKAAEEADGRIHFTLIGSLMAPTPKWSKEGSSS